MGDTADAELLGQIVEKASASLHRLAAMRVDPSVAARSITNQVVELVRDARPQDGVLSGERYRRPDRLDRTRVWLLKPFETLTLADGATSWATHVALVDEGALVEGGIAFSARPPLMAPTLPLPPPNPCRVIVTGAVTRDGLITAQVHDHDPLQGANLTEGLLAIIEGRAGAALHFGGWEWDVASAAAVARGAGLRASQLDGTPFRFNRPAPVVDSVLIADPALSRVIRGSVIDRPDQD